MGGHIHDMLPQAHDTPGAGRNRYGFEAKAMILKALAGLTTRSSAQRGNSSSEISWKDTLRASPAPHHRDKWPGKLAFIPLNLPSLILPALSTASDLLRR